MSRQPGRIAPGIGLPHKLPKNSPSTSSGRRGTRLPCLETNLLPAKRGFATGRDRAGPAVLFPLFPNEWDESMHTSQHGWLGRQREGRIGPYEVIVHVVD